MGTLAPSEPEKDGPYGPYAGHHLLASVMVLANLGGAEESHPYGRRELMSEGPRASSFDELARGLASGDFSRRDALRLMGAALLGSALASIPGVAQAAPLTCPVGQAKCRHAFNNQQCCPSGQVCCRFFSESAGRRIKNCVSSAQTCTNIGGRVTRS